MATSKRTTTRRTGSTAQTENGTIPPVKVRSRKPKSPPDSTMARHYEDRQAAIAKAAYLRSERRGFESGHEVEDWLAAEAEVDRLLLGKGRAS